MRLLLIVFSAVFLITGCKRPDRRNISPSTMTSTLTHEKDEHSQSKKVAGHNIIDMKPMGGVYEIPVRINGSQMDFIFDTGASSISISELEALLLLKQGKLVEEDILGAVHFRDATGKISEGTTINLRSVVIGNKEIRNVEANVVHNLEAPLLLGQSALAQFGKVTIDYKRNQLSFE